MKYEPNGVIYISKIRKQEEQDVFMKHQCPRNGHFFFFSKT